MSCKVLRSTVPPSATPFFDRAGHQPHRTADIRPEAEAGDIQRLTAQVKVLEQSIEAKVEEARNTGFREGEAAGLVRAEQASRPIFDKLAAAIGDVSSLRKRLRQETEKDLVLLALAIAKRILHREISVDPMAVQGLIRAALEKVQSRDITEIRIYPGHEEAIRRCLAAEHSTGIEVICDPSLHPGDIIVSTKRGDLQASVDTQLGEIERGLTDRLQR